MHYFLNFFDNRNDDVKQQVQEENNMDISWDDWFCERSSDHSIPLIHGMNEFGSENHSKDLQKSIEEEVFFKDDGKFRPLLNNLNKNFYEKIYNRCFNDRKIEISRYLTKSYLSDYLLDHMCEMYDYSFIDSKSVLLASADYISYLLQLLLNIKCCVKKK